MQKDPEIPSPAIGVVDFKEPIAVLDRVHGSGALVLRVCCSASLGGFRLSAFAPVASACRLWSARSRSGVWFSISGGFGIRGRCRPCAPRIERCGAATTASFASRVRGGRGFRTGTGVGSCCRACGSRCRWGGVRLSLAGGSAVSRSFAALRAVPTFELPLSLPVTYRCSSPTIAPLLGPISGPGPPCSASSSTRAPGSV